MPRGGHNRKPTALKVIQGTTRPDRVSENEPAPVVLTSAPNPPAHLDRFGKQAWRDLAPALQRLGLLTEVDLIGLALVCDAYSQWRRASKVLYTMDPLDERYRSVAVSVERARNDLRLAGNEFGLSPASRSRLSVAPAEGREESVLDKLWKTS